MTDHRYEVVDKIVDEWHRDAEDTRSLREALDMTVEQYGAWVATGNLFESYEPPVASVS